MKKTFFRIDIEKGMEKISSMIVPTGQISDKKVEELLKVLICKHMLKDEEVLSSFCKERTKRYQNFLKFNRETSGNGRFRVIYHAQMSSMSIIITLIYDDELSPTEKNKITKTSSIKLD